MATIFPLHLVLSRFSDLNVTGRIPKKPRDFVGSGGFGDIYKGNLASARAAATTGEENKYDKEAAVVAIKSIRASLMNDNTFEKAFCKELYIWSCLEHVNIVKLHGFMVEDNYPSLILEWVCNGTVIQYVKANCECDRVKLCQGIANGIAYLHVKKNVIHSDLKGSNILVNNAGIPMLTDFGLARMTQYTQAFFQTTTRDATAGSVRWTAYELFPHDLQSGSDSDSSTEEDAPLIGSSASLVRPTTSDQSHVDQMAVPSASGGSRWDSNFDHESELPQIRIGEEDEDSEGHHTKETDIWAFGMAMYEIMTEEVPYSKHKQDAQVMFAIIRKKFPEKPRRMTDPMKALWKVCRGCWVHDPQKRLKIQDVVMQLSFINSTVQGRALIKTNSTGKRKRARSRSSFSDRAKIHRAGEASYAHLMPEQNRRSENRRRITQVCQECKRLKLKCDRLSPCSTCVKRRTIAGCIYHSPRGSGNDDTANVREEISRLRSMVQLPALPSLQRDLGFGDDIPQLHTRRPVLPTLDEPGLALIERSKTACISCRDNYQTCDGTRPRCGRCASLSIHCRWASSDSVRDYMYTFPPPTQYPDIGWTDTPHTGAFDVIPPPLFEQNSLEGINDLNELRETFNRFTYNG